MTDLFDKKSIKPMLIGESSDPFDSDDFIYELKLDGERCIAYLDPNTGSDLRNKRNAPMLPKVPELSNINEQAREKCILDGELIVLVDSKPNFYEIQRRSLTSNSFKIQIQASKYPASFIAYDILYYIDHETISLPLIDRKKLLAETVIESPSLSISRYIEYNGKAFYKLTEENDLEGIVAKRKDSKYFFNKNTRDWIKIKNLQDEDFIVCGYIEKENRVVNLVLGAYRDGVLIHQGHVTIGTASYAFDLISKIKRTTPLFMDSPDTIWLNPELVCTVQYMMKTNSGGMRQPVFKGLRDDKTARECIV